MSDGSHRGLVMQALASVAMSTAVTTATAQLPDLFTVSQVIECTPHASHLGQPIHVTWKGLYNTSISLPGGGYGPAYGPWEDGIFLSNNFNNILIGTAGFTGVLLPGRAYDRLVGFGIPDNVPDGTYRILVKIDYSSMNAAGRIIEADEGNNEASGSFGSGSVDITRLQIVGICQANNDTFSVSWKSVTNCTYEIWWNQGTQTPWSLLISNIVATPPTNTASVTRQDSGSAFYRIRAVP